MGTIVGDPVVAAAPDGAWRPPQGRSAAKRPEYWLPALAVGSLGFLTAAGNGSVMLLGLAVLAILVCLNNIAPAPRIDPVELSSTVLLAIVIAVPFGKLPHNRTTSYVAVIVLLAIGFSAIFRSPLERFARGSGLVLAMFGILAISSQLAPDAGGIKRLTAIAAGAIPAFYLGVRLDRTRLHTVAQVLLSLALVEALLAIAEPFAFPKHLWLTAPSEAAGSTVALTNSLVSSYERSQGTLGHPLALGVLLVVALGLLIRVLRDMKLWLRLSSGALLLVGLIFTGDRSCLLAALILLIVGGRLTIRRVVGMVAAIGAVVLLLVDLGAVKGALLTNFSSSGSYLHRVSAYSLIWKLFITQPAAAAFGGDGFSSTQRLFDHGLLETDGFNVVDNQFVLIQSQGGVVCLLLFLLIAILAIIYARSSLRPVIIFVVAVSAIFDWLSWTSDSALIFMLLGAGLWVAKQPAASPELTLPPEWDIPFPDPVPARHH